MYENQSFIRYWWDGHKINAADIWQNFDSLALAYNAAELITGIAFTDCEQSPKFGSFEPRITKKKNKEISPEQKQANKELYAKKVAYATERNELLNTRYKASLLDANNAKTTTTIEDIYFDIANEQVMGTNPQYFEFDIMVSGSSNDIYFDNAAFIIEYNTLPFGSYIAANNMITITNGGNFNNNTYINPNSVVIDNSSYEVNFACGTDFNAGLWNRTQLTTSPQQLAHVKIEIQNCTGTTDLQFISTMGTTLVTVYANSPSTSPINLAYLPYDNIYNNQPILYAHLLLLVILALLQ